MTGWQFRGIREVLQEEVFAVKIALLAAAALLPMTGTAQAPEPAQTPLPQQAARLVSPDRAGCVPIARQVAGPDRPPSGTRLDQQPPGEMLLAVDREVDGCREVTRLRQERSRAAAGGR